MTDHADAPATEETRREPNRREPARRDSFIFTTKVPPRECPSCHCQLDGSTGVSLDPNEPCPVIGLDDITCCAYCGTILVVTTIGFRMASDTDLARLDDTLRTLIFEFSATHTRHGRYRV